MVLHSIGVDIGGTTIATGLINQRGEIKSKVELPSVHESREEMFRQIVMSIRELLSRIDSSTKNTIKGIGVGMPGKVDLENGVAVLQNNLPLDNFPLVRRLEEEFMSYTVTMDNDVYMAAYGEHKIKNSNSDETFVYITISTGISCSIIDKNNFIRGNGFAGEIGFLPHDLNEVNSNRLEKIASGPAIADYGKDLTGNMSLTTKDVFNDFYEGKKYAKKIMKKTAKEIAVSVYSIICIIDPHRIVFGGSVVLRNPVFLDKIKEELDKLLIDEQRHILKNMHVSELENNQGIIGAGMKALDMG